MKKGEKGYATLSSLQRFSRTPDENACDILLLMSKKVIIRLVFLILYEQVISLPIFLSLFFFQSSRTHYRSIGIFAGDISPIDVITHLPVFCEEKNISYIYVPSKEELGAASQTKRPTSCVLISAKDDDDYKELYDECLAEIKASS